MKKGLVISWFYPPGNSSEGLVTFKLLKNSKMQYDVFTQNNAVIDPWNRRVEETNLTSDNITIIQAPGNSKKEWIEHVVRYYNEHKHEYDFIMSRAMPAEAHEAALQIKKKYTNTKWIASFGDPLVRTPYVFSTKRHLNPHAVKSIDASRGIKHVAKQLISPGRIARSIRQTVIWNRERRVAHHYKWLNDKTFQNADVLLFNNEFQKRHAFDGEHEDQIQKAIVLPHTFDRKLYPEHTKNKQSKLIFSYFGHLDSFRTPILLLKAIRQLQKLDGELAKKVEFRFYGPLADTDKLYIFNNNLFDIVKVFLPVQYLESLRLMVESDWLLAIDTNLIREMPEYVFLPSKLIDYFGARKNIFSITSSIGATATAIKQVGGGECVSFNVDEIFIHLSKIIYQGFRPVPYNKEALDQYSADKVAKKFDAVVQKLLKGQPIA